MANTADNNISNPVPTKKMFSVWKVLLPVAIGLGVVALLFWHDAKKENLLEVFESISFNSRTIPCIVFAFMAIFGRDFGLTWRFRELTNRQLKWSQAYEVDMLCEFTSCVTPSAVGGSSFGMIYLNSKGIEFGRATTLMMTTLFLDELFFVIFCPIAVLLTPDGQLFASGGETFSHGIKWTFWAIYVVLFIWTFILFTGIIWKPLWIQKTIHKLFSLKWLRRWANKADGLGQNMVATSARLRERPFAFWLKVFGGTSLSWISRFLVVNALFYGFIPSADPHQWLIFAREFVIWVVLMLSPTPGGSGLSEWLFSSYYGDLVTTAGMALVLAIFWRIITYYLYLCIGACIVPGWLKATVNRFRKSGDADKTTETAKK